MPADPWTNTIYRKKRNLILAWDRGVSRSGDGGMHYGKIMKLRALFQLEENVKTGNREGGNAEQTGAKNEERGAGFLLRKVVGRRALRGMKPE